MSADVECGKFFKAERGTLSLSGGRLRFESGERCVFDVPLSGIDKIVWHWYSFSAAFEARIGSESYFLSFVPRSSGLNAWYGGLTTGRQWRAALEGRPVPARGPLVARLFLVLMGVVIAFLGGCFFLLTLSVAVDETQTSTDRILCGVVAASGAAMGIVSAIEGTRRVRRMLNNRGGR